MSINGICANCEHWDTRAISAGEFVCELDGRLCDPGDTCEKHSHIGMGLLEASLPGPNPDAVVRQVDA